MRLRRKAMSTKLLLSALIMGTGASLGAVRTFVLKHKASGEKRTMLLAHGSLLVMAGTCQHHWLHGLPKTEAEVGERINLTFRRIWQ